MNLATIKLNIFFRLLIFGISLISLNSCGANEQSATLAKSQLNFAKQTEETLTDRVEKGVALRFVNLSSDKAVLELSNHSDKIIYLLYSPTNEPQKPTWVYHYGFVCREKGKKETNYNQLTSHGIPPLEPLQINHSFQFEVSPIPNINASCKVSLVYYDDEKAADLLNSEKIRFTESENALLDTAMKSVDVEFRINNLKK